MSGWYYYWIKHESGTHCWYADHAEKRLRIVLTSNFGGACWQSIQRAPFPSGIEPKSSQTASDWYRSREITSDRFAELLRESIDGAGELFEQLFVIAPAPQPARAGHTQRCAICEKTFESARPAKTCSVACRVKASRGAAKQIVTGDVLPQEQP